MSLQLSQVSRAKTLILYIVIWLLTCFAGFYFRLYPLLNHTSHTSHEEALVNVVTKVKKHIYASLEKQYPDMPTSEKVQLANQSLNEVLKENKDNFWKSVNTVARKLDELKGIESSHPYLLASDSFLYYGLTENIQETGKISHTISGSKYLNTFMLAPEGHWEPLNLHPYVGYYIHSVLSLFKPGIPLMYSVSFTPLFVMSLSVAAFLFACSIFGFGFWPALTASLYFVLAPIFVKRSTFGWYDNDPYNTFFPILILAILFYGFSKKFDKKAILVISALLALSVSVYALFWHGWVFLEGIILLSGLLIFLTARFLRHDKDSSGKIFFAFTAITLATFAGISLTFGVKEFFILFKEGWIALNNFLRPSLSIWPDLYIGVSELKRATLPFIVEQVGGYQFIFVSFLGLIELLRRAVTDRDGFYVNSSILILTFLSFSLFVTLGAERFVLLCLIPMSMLFAFGVRLIFILLDFLIRRRIRSEQTARIFYNGLAAFVAVVFLITPALLNINKKMPSLLNQIYNDVWHKGMLALRDRTPAESIINTWWPPGHFIKSVAKRRVTFDGATINVPQAYWLSNILLSNDERKALGLLRMLNNSANQAAEYLAECGLEISDGVDILKAITAVNKDEARTILKERIPEEKIEGLLQLTHARPPPSYIFLYNDFMEKNLQLSFIGNWDFKKIEKIRDNPSLRKNIPAPGSESYVDFLWTISGKYPKQTGPLKAVQVQGESIVFEQGITVNRQSMEASINSQIYGKGVPRSIVYLKGNSLAEKVFPGRTLSYSVLFFKKQEKFFCILLEEELAQSVLFQLYYLEGKSLSFIKPFAEEEDLSGRTKILIYEVDWESFYRDIEG